MAKELTIAELNTLVSADASKFQKEIKKAENEVLSLKAVVSKSANFIQGALAAFGAGMILNQVKNLVSSSMEWADNLARDATNLGLTTDALSELQYAAKLSDLEIETLTASITKMQKNLYEAATTGKGGAFDALKELGLDAKQLAAMSPDQALQKIAGAFEKIKNPAKATALAMELFGKSGAQMIGFLSKGEAGIQALREEAQALGVSLDEVSAAQINEANDAIDRMSAALQGVGNRLAIELAPVIVMMSEEFLKWAKSGTDATGEMTEGAGGMAGAFGVVADVLHTVNLAFEWCQLAVRELVAVTLDWYFEIMKFIPGMQLLGAAFDALGITEGAQEMAKAMREDAIPAWEEWNRKFMDQTPSERLNEVKAKLEAIQVEARPKPENLFTEIKADAEKASKAGTDFVTKLQNELHVLANDMNKEQEAIFKLRTDGADEGEIQQAEWLQANIKALKDQNDLLEKAKQLKEDLATPDEKIKKGMEELAKLRDAKLISNDEFDKASLALEESIKGKEEKKKKGDQFASLAEKGSQEAAQSIARHMAGGGRNDPQNAQKSTAKNTATMAKDIKTLIKKWNRRPV